MPGEITIWLHGLVQLQGQINLEARTTLDGGLSSASILTSPVLLSTANVKSQKYLYRQYTYALIREKLNFEILLPLGSDMLQLLLRVHQMTNPKKFPFMIKIRVDFETPKDNTTN